MVNIEIFKARLRELSPNGQSFAFGIHPDDYFELEAQALREKKEHPFYVIKMMNARMYVSEKVPRLV